MPRSYDAKVIDHLRRAGASTIAVDLEFTHPAANEQETIDLFEAVGRAGGKTVLGTVEVAKRRAHRNIRRDICRKRARAPRT